MSRFIFQLPEGFFHIGVVLHAGITRNPFCLQHGGNCFFVGLFQPDFKGKATGAE